MLDNITTSLPNNDIIGSRSNLIAVSIEVNLYRIFKNYFYNQHYVNFKGSLIGILITTAGPNDELYMKN